MHGRRWTVEKRAGRGGRERWQHSRWMPNRHTLTFMPFLRTFKGRKMTWNFEAKEIFSTHIHFCFSFVSMPSETFQVQRKLVAIEVFLYIGRELRFADFVLDVVNLLVSKVAIRFQRRRVFFLNEIVSNLPKAAAKFLTRHYSL